ncbi:hypothetical protein ACP93_12030 [Xanthomonas sp. NCPPB 1128]|uniref:hypothetical protein n=1 Tax=Xanthomonas sp. NCPPB 1128 TaxID=1775876 RepID=UPI00065ACC4F|nr:hypothetical protein [Xanthomonas sp. NCPPB 1128]KMM75351.1 hypothetical protein ACP93_12030 [Xanthomonas sp. NCPPB 1128]
MHQAPPRSNFVTILAWIFIALSGFGAVVGIMQVFVVFAVFDHMEFADAVRRLPPGMPPTIAFIFSNFRWLFLGTALFSMWTLASSIGLLRRLSWARWCFIAAMALVIVWNLGGAVVQVQMIAFMQKQLAVAQMQGAPDMQPMLWAMAAIGVVFAAAFVVLHGWIIARLLSRSVAAEFRRPSSTDAGSGMPPIP